MIVVNPTGGGLSNGKLALANATAGDVRSGKKFYAGNDVLKTGTLSPIKYKSGTFIVPEAKTSVSISLGFKPSKIFVFANGGEGYKGVFIYDASNSHLKSAICEQNLAERASTYISVSSTGFSFTRPTGLTLSEGETATYWAYS